MSGAGATALPPPRRRWWRRRRNRILLILAAFVVCIGPWPADNSTFSGSDYEKATLARLAAPAVRSGTLRVGVAEIDITPPVGHPLAGFGGRDPMASDSLSSRCHVRALTVSIDDLLVTILGGDLLLFNAKLSEAILERAGLHRGDVYFTATHTHNGPGGWGDHLLERLICGSYDPAYFDEIAAKAALAVARSREALVPAEVALATATAAGFQRNRMDPAGPTYDRISTLLFRRADAPDSPPLAAFAVFGAHATVQGSGSHAMGTDYPGALAEQLRRSTGAAMVLFAAGAVGDASPKRPSAATPEAAAEAFGRGLAEALEPSLRDLSWHKSNVLGNLRLEADLPPMRVHVASGLCLSPVCSSWIAEGGTHLHLLRIGPALLVGMPGDYAGGLAAELDRAMSGRDGTVIATSFNGDYRGYIIPRETFLACSKYETRLMNFYGPWLGPYLNHLAVEMMTRLGEAG